MIPPEGGVLLLFLPLPFGGSLPPPEGGAKVEKDGNDGNDS